MKKLFKIKVLGTEYTVYLDSKKNNNVLHDADGYIQEEEKIIVLAEENTPERNDTVIKHELTHAFLTESGLSNETWATNEEIVDWIARQLDKIYITSHEAIDKFDKKVY